MTGVPGTLRELIEHNAAQRPDQPALLSARQTLTFTEFAERARRLANALLARELEPGDRVSVLAQNSPAVLEIFAACEIAGLIAAPVNFRLTAEEIIALIAKLRPRALFHDPEYAGTLADLPALPEHCFELRHEAGDAYERLIETASGDAPPHRPQPDDIAHIVHTSGTTGVPKGAMLSHRALCGAAQTIAHDAGIASGELGLIVQPLFHVGAQFIQLAHHLSGAAVRVERRFDPPALWKCLCRDGVHTVQLAPTMIDMLLAEKPDSFESALHTIFYSTAPMPEALLRRGLEVFGPVFLQHYGSTEGGVITTLRKEQHTPGGTARQQAWLRSAGQANRDVELQIVGDAGEQLPTGETGEIWARHAALFSGYFDDPTASRDAFDDGWYKCGDVGHLDDDGFLYIVDRKKDMIISGGENIYPREVEYALERHRAIAECAVIGVPDRRWGEAVLAVVVTAEHQTVEEQELIDHCRQHIASYKKPKRVIFSDSLPRLATGKVDKVALRKPYWENEPRRI